MIEKILEASIKAMEKVAEKATDLVESIEEYFDDASESQSSPEGIALDKVTGGDDLFEVNVSFELVNATGHASVDLDSGAYGVSSGGVLPLQGPLMAGLSGDTTGSTSVFLSIGTAFNLASVEIGSAVSGQGIGHLGGNLGPISAEVSLSFDAGTYRLFDYMQNYAHWATSGGYYR